MQKILRLRIGARSGQSRIDVAVQQSRLDYPSKPVPTEKLFADLLKREATRAMQAVTECPPDTIPAHLARLQFIMDLCRFAQNHSLVYATECRLSGAQLLYPSTLADYCAAMEITRKTHRAPAFITERDEALEGINRKLDLIAGMMATNPRLVEMLTSESEVVL